MRTIAITGGPCAGKTSAMDVQRARLERSGVSSSPDAPVLVSACLLGEPCRYDGKAMPCEAVIEVSARREFVPVCPEVLGGLPTPRSPAEIQANGRVVDVAGADKTAAFEAGAREALRIARERGCKQAILKENSPSCGVNAVYDGTFSGNLVPGQGKTAALLAEAGIEAFSEIDIREWS